MQISSVQEYLDFAERHKLPLKKMRFFPGEKRTDPKCFYCYFDQSTGEWVTAKNKADGSTAERYRGHSEAIACQVLFDKMEEEAKKRGLIGSNKEARVYTYTYTDENGVTRSETRTEYGYNWDSVTSRSVKRKGGSRLGDNLPVVAGVILIIIVMSVPSMIRGLWHRHDGYYVDTTRHNTIYRLGHKYYSYDSKLGQWSKLADDFRYMLDIMDELYYTTSYYQANGQSGYELEYRFEDTKWYEDYEESYSSSSDSSDSDWDSDWSSWDSSDTDWDSDW